MKFSSPLLASLCLLAALLLPRLEAANAQPAGSRVRGTIESVNGQILIVKARDGTNVVMRMAGNVRLTGVVLISRDEIKVGAYIGVTSVADAQGNQKATEVHLFPDSLRGAGEGTWTDADQLGLERGIGDLIKSPNAEIFRERLSDVHNRISRAFTEPVGVDLPPIGDQQPEPGAGGVAQAAAPPKKPAVSKEQLSTMPVGSVFNGYKKTAGGWVPMTENDISDSMIPRP